MATEEKTEQATPRRRQEARKKGQVAKSTEISSAFIILFGTAMLGFYGKYIYVYLERYMQWVLSPAIFSYTNEITVDNFSYFFLVILWYVFKILLPFVAVILVVALGANFAQVGMLVSFESIKPSFKKINPISGLSRLFSLRSLTELVKSVLKISLISYVGYSTIKAALPDFIRMLEMDIQQALVLFGVTTLWLSIKVGLLFVILAFLDLVYQKYEFEKSIKMTKQEIKDEYKQREGDPLVRRRIREKQREIAMRRMMAAIPTADVVITNPIELAVALKYDADEMYAPEVVAKGGGVVAEKIKQIAKENNVPIVEDKSLAQSLFRLTDIGDPVPPQLFKAVAEILAYIYRISKKSHKFGI